jgi:predicted MFS family arabinose efflux permease
MPPAARASVPLFAVFAAGYFLSYFLRSANAVLAPDLQADVGLGPADLGLMTSAFFAAYAAAQFPVGLALDRWGPRRVASSLMLLGVAGALLFAVGTSLPVLALGRVLLGVGLGSVLLAGLKAFALWWPVHRYATVSGLYFAVGSLGALLAASPLAWANAAIGWRATFVVAAGVVAAVAAALALRTPATPTRRGPASGAGDAPDAPGTGLAIATLMLLGFAFTGPAVGFQTLWAGPYLYDAFGTDPATTGRLLLVLSLGISVGYAASGALADRFGLYRVTVVAALAFVAAQAALAAIDPERAPLALVAAVYAAYGVTGGHCVLVLANARALLGAARSGRATGAINAASIGGVFALQWGMGVVVEAYGGADGYRVALAATAALTLAALTAHAVARRRLGRTT